MYEILIIIILIIIGVFFLNSQQNNSDVDTIIKTLLVQSSRWGSASLQDQTPIIAVLHANYAAGYLWALRDIVSGEQIKKVTGVDIIKFQRRITEVQTKATKRMVKLCPEFAGDTDKYLAAIAGEG